MPNFITRFLRIPAAIRLLYAVVLLSIRIVPHSAPVKIEIIFKQQKPPGNLPRRLLLFA